MKTIAAFVLAASAAALSTPALAQFAKPEDAIKYRQSALTVMATHFGRLGAMVNGRVAFDAKAAAENAAIVETLSKLPWAAFGEGTDKGGNTKALPEVWKEQAKFKEASEKLMAEVVKLNAAAKVGTLDSLKGAFGNVGAACKGCHDNFRAK
ncbi:MAG: cytochrome c [Rhodoferax sp.]|uniref:c-type cytochrome n=1 Tax=Rhodoferax sp. TaxID=50421 RepID=UPI0026231F4B|nr:cytochrome c [Rhodoferax sp.]MDD5332799.1 cytochrome c [Rhodoferax sp.]